MKNVGLLKRNLDSLSDQTPFWLKSNIAKVANDKSASEEREVLRYFRLLNDEAKTALLEFLGKLKK